MNANDRRIMIQVAAVGAGALLLGYLVKRSAGAAWDGVRSGASRAADFVGQHASATFNPGSTQNAAYRGVNAMGASVSGDEHWTLGGWLYDVFNPPAPEPVTGYAWLDLPDPYPLIVSGRGGRFLGHGASGTWEPEPPDYGIYF